MVDGHLDSQDALEAPTQNTSLKQACTGAWGWPRWCDTWDPEESLLQMMAMHVHVV